MPIPRDTEQLTASWLSAAIDADVRAVEVIEAHSGTTGRVRLRVDGEGLPPSLFCKIEPFYDKQKEFVKRSGIGVAEARFYLDYASELPVRVPALWHAAVDADGGFVMVLEDLEASGCRFPRPNDDDPEVRVQSTVTELAALHLAFRGRDLGWVPDRAGFGDADSKSAEAAVNAGSFIERAVEKFGRGRGAEFTRLGELYVAHTAGVLDWWDEGERTLVHGDPHLGNLFVDGSRTGFYDWGMVSHSPGMRDVAYYLGNSVRTEVRREMESDLLADYAEKLGLAVDVVWAQYRLFAIYSWVSAVSTATVGSRWQPEHVWRGGMERATATISDLDSVGLLEERFGR